MRRLIALFLLAIFPVSAKPTVVALEWGDFQEVAKLVRFREKVTVRTGAEGRERIRGKLVGVSGSGIRISKKGRSASTHVLIDRERVHSVRMLPRRGNPIMWRVLAGAAAFPLWLVGLTFGLSIPGGIPEGRWYKNRNAGQGIALAFALPAAVYLIAQRADRRGGAIVFELDEGKEDLQ